MNKDKMQDVDEFYNKHSELYASNNRGVQLMFMSFLGYKFSEMLTENLHTEKENNPQIFQYIKQKHLTEEQ